MCTSKAQRVSAFEALNDKTKIINKMCLEYVVWGYFCYYCLPLYHSIMFRVFMLPLYTRYLCCSFPTTHICALNVSCFSLYV